jgi:C-terminal peptidase prc
MTKVTLTGLVGGLVLALAVAAPGRAADDKTHPCVVLVGISQYADEQIVPRPHAEADVQALYDLFTSKENLALPADQVRLLLGKPDAKRPSELATHANILKALRWAATSAGRDDLVILAFVLPGAPLNERGCYFATDSTFKDRSKDAVSASEIEEALAQLKSRHFCAFLDVNFKGFKPGKGAPTDVTVSNFYHEFMATTKEDTTVPPGRVLFLANLGTRPALDLGKHGLFTHVLLKGLQGAADKEGYEPDGIVTVDELSEYLKKEYNGQIRQHAKTDEERAQQLVVLGGRSSHFELTRNPAVVAQVKARLDKFTKMALDKLDKDVAKTIAEEGKNLLSRMPKLEAQRTLRKKYQQLADGDLTLEQFVTERTKILDGMKLDRPVAEKFAATVLKATHQILGEYVKEVNQGDLVASAIKGLYLRADEKIPLDVKERLDKAKGLKEKELRTLLADVRQKLGKREDLDNHKDVDYALQRMLSPLDPYTTYIDPETLSSFKREMGGNFTGIGVQIRTDVARDQLVVISPIKDSPAYKAGIKAGDVITHIKLEKKDPSGNTLEPPEVIPTKGLPINDAVKKISGQEGTEVKLIIEREGVTKPLEIKVLRGNVEVETVLGFKRKADDSWDYVIDPQDRICYVRLTQFSRYTERDLARVLEKLQSEPGIKGFVLDLRFNPGGLLTSAVNISDMFISDGLIVTIRPRVGREQPYLGEQEGSLTNFPMVCLVNGHSASGSEIVSACLQDHNRAIVMGERSYGKGSVQNIQPFEKGELKLTTASFWRPSGKNLNRSSTKGRDQDEWGVSPDKGYVKKLEPKERDALEGYFRKQEIIPRRDLPSKETANGKAEFKDTQLEMALKYLRGQIKLAEKAQAKKAG